jgi:hypothetical protein
VDNLTYLPNRAQQKHIVSADEAAARANDPMLHMLREVPFVIIGVLPETERKAADQLFHLLIRLGSYTERYQSALHLFLSTSKMLSQWRAQSTLAPTEEARFDALRQLTNNPAREWSNIALRDSIMTVYHYGCILKAITFKGCPTLQSMVDAGAIKATKRLFQQARFPNWENARHALSHESELSATPEATERNSVDGYVAGGFHLPNAKVMLSGVRQEDKLTTTLSDLHRGPTKLIQMECSEVGLGHLVATTNSIYLAFEPASQKTFELVREMGEKEKLSKQAP